MPCRCERWKVCSPQRAKLCGPDGMQATNELGEWGTRHASPQPRNYERRNL